MQGKIACGTEDPEEKKAGSAARDAIRRAAPVTARTYYEFFSL